MRSNDSMDVRTAASGDGEQELLLTIDQRPAVRADDLELTSRFKWNGKDCKGNKLHKAVRCKAFEDVFRILEHSPSALHSRFVYETTDPTGAVQEGTGEAIHIAAGHQELDLMEFLLHRKASVHAKVTRGCEDHYAVLHAAIFAEGRGGHADVVRRIVEVKADMDANLHGEYPLHIAFRAGKLDLINILRDEREKRNLPDLEDDDQDLYKGPTPLEIGISRSGMTTLELVMAARLSAASLRVFAKHEPRAIPMFLARLQSSPDLAFPDEKMCLAAYLAKLITVKELACVLLNCPLAADALLTAVTSAPHCRSKAMHPLPPKVRMNARHFWQSMASYFNPPIEYLPSYQKDHVWEYDGNTFTYPEWHSFYTMNVPSGQLIDRAACDVEIQVCHISDLASAEFFLALKDGLTKDPGQDLSIFDNIVLRGLISVVWWDSAVSVELMQGFLDLWVLVLLLVELYMSCPRGAADERLLMHEGGAQGGATAREGDAFGGHAEVDFEHREPSDFIIACDFLVARGIAGFLHHAHLLWALVTVETHVRQRHILLYCNTSNLLSLGILMLLWVDLSWLDQDANMAVRLFAIMRNWLRLMKANLLFESIGKALLPLVDVVGGLLPSVALTVFVFCCYVHMRLYMLGGLLPWGDIMKDSFSTLFTGGLESTGFKLDLMLTYGGVTIFTLFMLNIFIGVISEVYQDKEQIVDQRYQQLLSESCLSYLLRFRLIPTHHVSYTLAVVSVVISFVVMLVVQTVSLVQRQRVQYSCAVFLVCMVVLDLMSYCWSRPPWVKVSGEFANSDYNYLWVAKKVTYHMTSDDLVSDLRKTVEELKADRANLARQLDTLRRTARAPSSTAIFRSAHDMVPARSLAQMRALGTGVWNDNAAS